MTVVLVVFKYGDPSCALETCSQRPWVLSRVLSVVVSSAALETC
jgi:hypothetical protein